MSCPKGLVKKSKLPVTSGNADEAGHLPKQLDDTMEGWQQSWEGHLQHLLIAVASDIHEKEHPAQI